MRNIIISLLFISCFVIWIIIGKSSLKKNKSISKGKITYRTNSARNGGYINANFYYKGKKYEASTPITWIECENNDYNIKLFGKEVYIIFDSLNPSNSHVLTTSNDYQENNLNFPDFLDSLFNNCH